MSGKDIDLIWKELERIDNKIGEIMEATDSAKINISQDCLMEWWDVLDWCIRELEKSRHAIVGVLKRKIEGERK